MGVAIGELEVDPGGLSHAEVQQGGRMTSVTMGQPIYGSQLYCQLYRQGVSQVPGMENPQQTQEGSIPNGVAGAPNEAALLALMDRTGYTMIQENGQRKFGGPPPGWDKDAPPRGCEIFVGKIPRDCYEDELVPIFEKIGRIYELRLMMDFSGTNRGYCFVMFCNRDDAKKAVRELNNYELRKGRFLGVCLSVDNCRLFVGGIPKNKEKEEILAEMRKVTEGVVDVIVYPSATDKSKNRGFAFVEYESHRAAAMARRKLIPGRIQLFGHQIAVDWAEPEAEVDEDIMSKVKVLYIRNLMLTTTEDALRAICEQAAGPDKVGCVERTKKIRDYAFVHYSDRTDAINAMRALDGSSVEGSRIEVVLAKPVDKNDHVRYTRGAGRGGPLTQAALSYGYDLAYAGSPATYLPGQYPGGVALGAGLAGAGPASPLASSQISPRGFIPPRGVQNVARSPLRGRGRGAAGIRGAGGRTYLTGRNTGIYRKHPAELLEDFCAKNGWGMPVYQLHSTMGHDNSGDVQLFLYKVSIPGLAGTPNSNITPNKLCRTVDEAKHFAAEYVLMQFNVPMEAAGGDASTAAMSAYNPAALYPNAAALAATGRPLAPAGYSLSPLSPTAAGSSPTMAPQPRSDLLLTSMPVATTAASYMMAAQNAKMAATTMAAANPYMTATHAEMPTYNMAAYPQTYPQY